MEIIAAAAMAQYEVFVENVILVFLPDEPICCLRLLAIRSAQRCQLGIMVSLSKIHK